MSKFVKKPVEVEAIQYTGYNYEEILDFCGESVYFSDNILYIVISGKDIPVNIDDYIVKDAGKIYPCNPDIFEETYDAVED